MVLSEAIFTEIGDKLKNKQFYIGKNATDHKQRIIYNDNNGKIFYDEDGKGGAPKVLFAIVHKDLDMHASDFVMIA
jgi:hypothetical protein